MFPAVRVIPLQPHCFAFGGFELQMIGAMRSARSAGVDIGPLDFWSREDDFDVIHCWGIDAQHLNAAKWARAARKRVVISGLLGHPSWRASVRRRLLGSRRVGGWDTKLLAAADALTVVSPQQARLLGTVYGVPLKRIVVVPNIVDDCFFSRTSGTSVDRPTDLASYVLAVGNICLRKNQRALVKACLHVGVPLLLVGDVLLGEAAYGEALAADIAGAAEVRWLRGLPPGSPELVAAFANAALVALPSYDETQPISALEAVAMGKPLMLGDRPYARQEFYANAALVDPGSVASISKMLQHMLSRPQQFETPRAVIENCRESSVGAAYADVYRSVSVS